jgi:hypothetical protein
MRLLPLPVLVAAVALLGACAPAPEPAAQPDGNVGGYDVRVFNIAPQPIDLYYYENGAPVLLGSVPPEQSERFQFVARAVQLFRARTSVGLVRCRGDDPKPGTLIELTCRFAPPST